MFSTASDGIVILRMYIANLWSHWSQSTLIRWILPVQTLSSSLCESHRASENKQAWASRHICMGVGPIHSCKHWLTKPWSSSASCFGMTSLVMLICRPESCRSEKEWSQVPADFSSWHSHGLLGQDPLNLCFSSTPFAPVVWQWEGATEKLSISSNNHTLCGYK